MLRWLVGVAYAILAGLLAIALVVAITPRTLLGDLSPIELQAVSGAYVATLISCVIIILAGDQDD